MSAENNEIKGFKGHVNGKNRCHTCEYDFEWKFPNDGIVDKKAVALTVVYESSPDFTDIEKLEKPFTVYVNCPICNSSNEFRPIHYMI